MKKTFYKIVLCTLSLCTVLASCQKKDNLFNVDGDCLIDSLVLDEIYPGVVDHASATVTVAVPEVHDDHLMTITTLRVSAGAKATPGQGEQVNMTSPIVLHVENGNVYRDYKIPNIKTTDGATVSPRSGMPCDFTNPVDFTVTYNTASTTYKVTVKEKGNPVVLYLGLAQTAAQLNPEEQEAVNWMLANVENSDYASFTDLAAGRVVMTDCKVIWWHFHKDGGLEGKGAFEANAPEAVDYTVLDRLKEFYHAGGSFLLTRYAVNLPYYLGEAECFPNNAWGGKEAEAERVNSPWEFAITGHTDHALWQNLTMDPTVSDHVYTCDEGYKITNSTAQYHIGSDWGGYADRDVFHEKTGAYDIAGGTDAVVAWEFRKTAEHGTIICIGSGCYDWYTTADPSEYTSYYHENIAKITENAFNYLKQ